MYLQRKLAERRKIVMEVLAGRFEYIQNGIGMLNDLSWQRCRQGGEKIAGLRQNIRISFALNE
jgi:hypothetical protein